MSESHPSQPSEKPSPEALVEHMDTLLAQGREAMTRMDKFYHDHDLVPGIGERKLLSNEVPEKHQIILARLLAGMSRIDENIDECNPASTKPAPIPVSARAVGNRYRI